METGVVESGPAPASHRNRDRRAHPTTQSCGCAWQSSMVRYIIIGAGAIGGVLGARLQGGNPKHPPLLIVRGEHGAIIASRGLRLRTPDEDITVPIATAASANDILLREDDVLIFATKTHQLKAAILEWVDQPVYASLGTERSNVESKTDTPVGTASDRLPVFMALNGVASETIALRFFSRVFGICIWMPAVHLSPGEVIARNAPITGTFLIGRHGHQATERDRKLLDNVAADWRHSSFTVHLVNDILRWKYGKLVKNLPNAVQALLGAAGADAKKVDDALQIEGKRILTLAGIEWSGDDEELRMRGTPFHLRPVPGVSAELGGSSWQSMARGTGTIESDFLNGEIALIARLHGEEAPLNATLQRLVRRAAARGAGASSMTVTELETALGL